MPTMMFRFGALCSNAMPPGHRAIILDLSITLQNLRDEVMIIVQGDRKTVHNGIVGDALLALPQCGASRSGEQETDSVSTLNSLVGA